LKIDPKYSVRVGLLYYLLNKIPELPIGFGTMELDKREEFIKIKCS
jgi:hypothetical protein